MRKPSFVLLAALLLAACESDPPTPSGNLQRPSGLAFVERESANRADLFIADSEAQGVRILQYGRAADGSDVRLFVVAPVVFFPLVIPAPGFPTRISASLEVAHDRLFAIAPASGLLHVLEVREAPLGATADQDVSNVSLAQISLDFIGPNLVPVDVQTLESSPDEDIVAVVLDALDSGPGVLAVMAISRATNALVESRTETTTVAKAPRDLVVRDPMLLISSAATASVTQVRFDSGAAQVLGPSSTIGVGGETGALIEAGNVGVFAIRLDRSAVVLLEQESMGAFARSNRRFVSPYTPESVRSSSSSLGRIDLRTSAAAAGGHGRVSELAATRDGETIPLLRPSDLDQDGDTDVVLLAHLDGRVSFLIGNPPRLAVTASAAVTRLSRISGTDLAVDQCNPGGVSTCEGDIANPELTACSDVVQVDSPFRQIFRATYRGALASSRGATLSWIETSSAGARFRLRDPNIDDFAKRLVQPGDSVLVQLRSELKCSSGDVRDLVGTGTVSLHSGDIMEVVFSTGPVSQLELCADVGASVAHYEVYPSGDEAVLTTVVGEAIVEVLQRTDVDAGGARATFDSRVRFTMTSPSGFTCTTTSAMARFCSSNAQCGVGRTCGDPAESALGGCPRDCQVECSEGIDGCVEEQVRRCSALELEVSGTNLFALDLTDGAFPPAAPADVVFSSMRSSWITSYPGARGLAEVRSSVAECSDSAVSVHCLDVVSTR